MCLKSTRYSFNFISCKCFFGYVSWGMMEKWIWRAGEGSVGWLGGRTDYLHRAEGSQASSLRRGTFINTQQKEGGLTACHHSACSLTTSGFNILLFGLEHCTEAPFSLRMLEFVYIKYITLNEHVWACFLKFHPCVWQCLNSTVQSNNRWWILTCTPESLSTVPFVRMSH